MNKFLGFLVGGLVVVSGLVGFGVNDKSPVPEDNFEIPENINAIFNNHCFGCHNSESKNEDGKEELMIDKLGKMRKSKLASKLSKIGEAISEGEMPPEKFLKKYPDKALSDKDAKTLIEWAKASAEAL